MQLFFVVNFIYSCFRFFPRQFSDQVLDAKKVESHQAGCEFESRDGYAESLRDFPRALGKLVLNAPFMCISGMATAEWFVYAGLTSFGPKFFESQFNISAGEASNDIGKDPTLGYGIGKGEGHRWTGRLGIWTEQVGPIGNLALGRL